jgi:hypothetical protein
MIGRLQFILRYTEMEYTAYYALNRGKQVLLGKVDTMDLSDKDFTGPIIGLHALGDSRLENGLYVPFEDFVVDSA